MNRNWRIVAMQPRGHVRLVAAQLLISLALGGAPAWAQTPVVQRDSNRVYRYQWRRSSDSVYERSVRDMRRQLEFRLDSLVHELDGMGSDAPDRRGLERGIHSIIASLKSLADVQTENARGLARSKIFVATPRRPVEALQPGWIGINAEAPHERVVRNDSAYIRYFSYPEVISVEPNSPAERVGIARGDRLIAYDGADLRDREINLTKLLQPSRRITITIRRDGEERELPILVTKPPLRVVQRWQLSMPDPSAGLRRIAPRLAPTPPAPAPFGPFFERSEAGFVPVVGAKLVAINDEDFGHIFGVSSGVLVLEVFSDPAQSSGLKGGDVIRRADGQSITDVAQLRRIVAEHGDDREVELEIVRQKRTRPLMLRW